jgi:RNA polymerase sigma factor (sigma-70 family)
MNNLSDDILISGIRNRDDTAFKYLQVKFQDGIRLMVIEMGGTQEDAKDVFSDGIIELIRLVEQDDFKLTCKLGTLVYALCKKKWKQQLEKRVAARNYRFRRDEPEPPLDFTEDTDEELYRNVIWESFRKLDESCKRILEGYLKEISPKEIATSLGYSYNYVRKRKSLCYSYLMELIENHPDFVKIKETEAILSEETTSMCS